MTRGRIGIQLTYNDETHSLSEWARRTDQPLTRLYNRYRRGYSTDEIINGPQAPEVITHPPSTVYAIRRGSVVELQAEPKWMQENCQ